jgi:hypothetical protein
VGYSQSIIHMNIRTYKGVYSTRSIGLIHRRYVSSPCHWLGDTPAPIQRRLAILPSSCYNPADMDQGTPHYTFTHSDFFLLA